ncbi:GrpB family protein [Scytonema sp. NUACC26]|uniref:GrpB family protein n=1 Tax=Scytonema sp. NUACC26 TaxID=3140176 RepID=UPI0034DBE160
MTLPNEATDNTEPTEQVEGVPQEPMTEAQLQAVTIGAPVILNQPILIVDYDPEWPQLFEREATRIRADLGDRALSIEHVGSTSVPGLAAKPRIDILLVVANSADEANYVPALEATGYVLTIREPDWYQHRMLKGPDTDVNLHIFSQGCAEIERMLLFRNWLRCNPGDRQLYEQTKRQLAQQSWKYTQNYADAKSTVVAEILARAQKAAKSNEITNSKF